MTIEEITAFVETVLRKRFHDVLEKQKIDGSSDRKLNFACPICGDSQKKVSKKRGNLYLDTKHYKCFNDGCMAYMSLSEFVAKMSREHGIMLPSFVLEDGFKATPTPKKTENQLIRFLTSDTSQLVTISEVINRFSLKRLDMVPDTSIAYQYIKSRYLHLIKDYGDFLYTDSQDNKVFIFNFDKKSGKLLGFAMRTLNESISQKYIIRSYTDLTQIFSQLGISKQLVDDANFLNNYFNILNIDFSKPIRITEGQFDSMFIDNAIATSGATKARSIFAELGAKSATQVIFDRDKAGKTQMMNFIKQGYSVFLWNKAIGDLKKKYSTKDDLLNLTKVKDINDLFKFLQTRDTNHSIEKFNVWINGYFSESIFDLGYL
jgi:hypothetical protein